MLLAVIAEALGRCSCEMTDTKTDILLILQKLLREAIGKEGWMDRVAAEDESESLRAVERVSGLGRSMFDNVQVIDINLDMDIDMDLPENGDLPQRISTSSVSGLGLDFGADLSTWETALASLSSVSVV